MRLGGRFGQQSFRGHRDRNEQQTIKTPATPAEATKKSWKRSTVTGALCLCHFTTDLTTA